MNDEFIKNALNRGDKGKAWLDSIPNLIAEYEQKWSLHVHDPFTLNYNYVAPATRLDGTSAVLKLGFPKDLEFFTEIDALQIFNGEKIAQLLEIDREKAIILIERVSPGVPLSSIDDDEEATKIIASIIKTLWKPLPSNHHFTTIAQWSDSIPNMKKKFNNTSGPLPSYLVDEAEKLFSTLIESSASSVLLHGDLHQDNILSSDREEWLAIDPKGISGELAYETAAMIRNPYKKIEEISDIEPVLKNRIKILSKELDIDPAKIRNWALAQTVLSAVWNIEEGKEWKNTMKIAATLYALK